MSSAPASLSHILSSALSSFLLSRPSWWRGPAPEFSVSDRSFNFRSLLGNAVLRWEWSPGSTLFLVWQQSRAGRVRASEFDETGALGVGDFDLGYDTRELFGLRDDNIFLVKVNYWLNF